MTLANDQRKPANFSIAAPLRPEPLKGAEPPAEAAQTVARVEPFEPWQSLKPQANPPQL